MSSGPGADASFAELMTIAARHVRIATAQLATDVVTSRDDAADVVRCHSELIHALAAQARVLIGPASVSRAVIDSARPDPVSLAAARFTHALEKTVPRRPDRPQLLGPDSLARPYSSAAVAVRVATDLVLTQIDHLGRVRTPDAQLLLSPRGRLVALNDTASVAIQLAETRQRLHEQVRGAKGRGNVVKVGTVPDLTAVQGTAGEVQAMAAKVLEHDPSLREVGDFGPGRSKHRLAAVSTPDPIEELRLRTTRLRQLAWELATAGGVPAVSTQALANFAAVGVAVNSRAAVVGARLAGMDWRDPQLPDGLSRYLAKADAWRDVREQLLRLHTTAPQDRVITAEAHQLVRVAVKIVPTEWNPAEPITEGRKPTAYAAMGRASEALDQIANWNSRTVTRLAAAGDLYLSGRYLAGEQVTNDTELVTAKLADKPVRAPDTAVAAIRDSYRTATVWESTVLLSPKAFPQSGVQPPGPSSI